MAKVEIVDGRCPACGSKSIHEAFCSVGWAEMAEAYNKGRERYPEAYDKERTDGRAALSKTKENPPTLAGGGQGE